MGARPARLGPLVGGASFALRSRALSEGLARQAPLALGVLLEGWQRTARGRGFRGLAQHSGSEVYRQLRRVVLGAAVLLFVEDRGLLPAADPHAAELLSVRRLFEQLECASRARPGALGSSFGAWPRLRCAFRAARFGDDAPAVAVGAIDDGSVYRMLRLLLAVGEQPCDYASLPVEQLGTMFEALLGHRVERAADTGAFRLSPSGSRRSTGSHYTPRSLSVPIVERALEPVLLTLGSEPRPADLLRLRVCDPAMGSGAFLAAACRLLADRLLDAWARHGERAWGRGDPVTVARQLVAQTCLYGVDSDPMAVELARVTLWLTAGASDLSRDGLDHNLRHGDSLVGLNAAQLAAFHWQPQAPARPVADVCEAALSRAGRLRRQLLSCVQRGATSPDGLRRLRRQADELVEDARLLGDLVVGAFFEHPRGSSRQAERDARLKAVGRWLRTGGRPPVELRRLRVQIRTTTPVFHWPLEFPEVFSRADGAARSDVGMAVVIGNPPFLGGKRISTEHGMAFAAWLQQLHGSTKNTDLAAHFFRRADSLVGQDGTIGFIATNTLAQGATRRDGLRRMIFDGPWLIYDAVRSQDWPGAAAVNVSVVHLAKGQPSHAAGLERRLDGRPVSFVNSGLRAMPERREAAKLASSSGLCFIGCFLRGSGFIISSAERRELLRAEPEAALCLPPFLGGDEVNASPRHEHHRYVIAFFDRSLEEAGRWPKLLSIVRQRVKPVRDGLRDHGVDRLHKRRWWQFANTRPELRAAVASLPRCLVAPRVSKHLCFAFQPPGRVWSDQLCVFAIADYARFAVLQSRVHEPWARTHSSTFGEGLRYTPSACVETFPFPPVRQLARGSVLEVLGRELYVARARHLRETDRGLTTTYNALKEAGCSATAIRRLRLLHERLDRAVLDAYGWSDLGVPPYHRPASRAERRGLESYEADLIDRLYRLNEERSRQQQS